MGIAEGKVAVISGAARGQGRSHAVRLAREGADIIGLDICEDISTMTYPNATRADLAETVDLVAAEGHRMIASVTDVRDAEATRAAVDAGLAELGRIDIVLCNAGIIRLGDTPPELEPQTWQDTIGVNLDGSFHLIRATVPHLIDGGRGGSIILTGSTAGTRPIGGLGAAGLAYTASKWALKGIGKQLALALAEHMIRVNVIHPTGVLSGMTMNDAMMALHAEAMVGGDSSVISAMANAMPVEILEPADISNAIAFLVSDQAKYITGVSLPVDAGFAVR
jgi:SDR family mycofactocin-dependent oxidoreductase